MGSFLGGFLLPLLLLTAALINWSLVSLTDLLVFLFIQFNAHKIGFIFGRRFLVLWPIIIFSSLVIFSQVTFLVIWSLEGYKWSLANAWWAKLIGFMTIQSWKSPSVIYFLVVQLLAIFVAAADIYRYRIGLVPSGDSCWVHFLSFVDHLELLISLYVGSEHLTGLNWLGHASGTVTRRNWGSHLRVASCLLLPAIQIIVGISHSSWVSLPFFIGSCVGLVDWSLTSNFLGLFRWWRPLQLYAGFSIFLFYVYQLPVEYPSMLKWVAEFIGLFKISSTSEWPEICSYVSLILFYIMLSCIKCDLEEMDFIMSMREGNLVEQLLPSKHSFFIRELRSGVKHTNVLLRREVFQTFTINFFTYGFPVSLVALSFWSFHFASLCAFGLLAYVGYIVYAFPSLFRLHRLNGLLLVFILFWAISTYIFNVAFTFLNRKIGKDMHVWEMVGLWHYPIPGFFLLAQFGLGILVALVNLVNNSVFLCLSDEDERSSNDNSSVREAGETKVLIVATIAWGLRKSSRAIVLTLIFLVAMKPGFIHAVYVVFFLLYLLSHDVSRKMRQSLVLLNEVHFALLYLLQINLISDVLDREGSLCREILLQLAHTQPPVGFSILRAGLNKSVLLSVYTATSNNYCHDSPSHERKIALFLSSIGEKFLSMYRSCGTYIAFLTILLTVCFVKPNYISFGFLFLLLVWIIGRQLVERAKRRLWFPIKAYAIIVFVFIYCLSSFSSFRIWLSRSIDLDFYLGYNSEASSLQNCWQSLAVMIVMQLYSYERRQSRYSSSDEPELLEYGRFGFIKRFLIWHSDKILFAALFYASISPISAFGLLYLLGLVICATLPKTSHIPSKLFLAYTGVIMTAEYLFQMWGKQAEMFPGQKHSQLSYFLGFRVFGSGFWGLELGLRGKVLIIAACTLQYNVFRWLEKMPGSVLNKGKWDDPCPLFVSEEDDYYDISISNVKNKPSFDSGRLFVQQDVSDHISRSSFDSGQSQVPQSASSKRDNSECSSSKRYSFGFIWGSTKESHKWDKMRIISLRKERFEMQKIIFKIYMKFWMENLFNLFGLEITMISLLLASFALLNSVSLFYVGLLAACILLDRGIIRKLWPIFVFLFASILILEYIAFWKNMWNSNWHMPSKADVHCHDCWRISNLYFRFCLNCWLGLTVDDSRMLFSYFVVFMLSSLKLRADHLSGFSLSSTYREMMSQRKNTFVWRDLSFETKSMWTILDYLRLYCYCHLLDLVLALILITGTLEYDVLHLGYLAFALVFFRLRLEILKKKNKVFKFLRAYNFALIILSLAYQSPLVGEVSAGKCETMHYIFEMIGFYKYDYGFRITARSALVEIIIFMLVSLQSYMFSSQEFEYVCRYLEAEQIGAIVREQEKKAAWKTEQLQHIRDSEESKRQRNLQVEKMKSEMLNLQIQLHNMNSSVDGNNASPSPGNESLRKRSTSRTHDDAMTIDIEGTLGKVEQIIREDSSPQPELQESLANLSTEITTESRMHSMELPVAEICEIDSQISDVSLDLDRKRKYKGSAKGNPLMSAVQFIGDGVSQVQSIGNQAVSNLASFLNVTQDDDMNEQTNTEDRVYDQIESQQTRYADLERSSSLQSDKSSDPASMQLGRIFRHIWSQMRSNNDVVCYCCFILVFLWNFSLLSMVYLAALFVYAMCVNTGPGYMFWVVMLIYTELYILLQYLYQIIIQHCGLAINSDLLQELGFPTHRITSSFVVSSLPLFLVYLFTLLQSSITAKDGEWTYLNAFNKSALPRKHSLGHYGLTERAYEVLYLGRKMMMFVLRSLCKYWKSLTQGAESPPYFIQVSMDVQIWPEDGIQPERIESGINQLLQIIHEERCKEQNPRLCPFSSRVHVQSIERSKENSKVALVVLEVVYSSPSTDTCPEWCDSLTPAADVANEIRIAQRNGFVESTGFPYQILSVIGGGKREIDLYAYVFGADLTVFFFVAIFYQSVIKNNSEFLDVYQLEDQFPKEFVFILMIIFFLIVLDRCIYLCSFAIGKVIFYLFNLVLFTYAVTEYAWQMEPSNQHAGELALRAIFLAKAVSLALQAIQIRYGLPHKSTLYRQFLTSEVSRINYLGYRLYRALPFLYELRCVLDWSCTTTSLTMYDWLKLEDINASLYLVKCDAVLNRSQHKQGEKQTVMTKCCNGICLFFILLCVIWAPMLMYSSGNPTNVANPIKDASCQVDIKTTSGRLTLYQTTLCEKISWEKLNANMILDPGGYLNPYNKNDIQLICCQADASVLWLVPGVVQSRFIQSLDWKQDISVSFTWILTRDRPKGKEVVRYDRLVDPRDLPNQSDVQKVLNGSMNGFRIKNVYQRYFRVTGSGDVRPLEQEESFVSADLILNRENYEWWAFHDIQPINVSECGHFTGPVAFVISEEIPPQGILGDTLSKFSIWGLYITFVLAVGRFIRLQCSDLRMRIPYENLPSCDRLIAICEDIYAARAEGELGVEEVLYWTLVKIYRSPHMLLEYTKID